MTTDIPKHLTTLAQLLAEAAALALAGLSAVASWTQLVLYAQSWRAYWEQSPAQVAHVQANRCPLAVPYRCALHLTSYLCQSSQCAGVQIMGCACNNVISACSQMGAVWLQARPQPG